MLVGFTGVAFGFVTGALSVVMRGQLHVAPHDVGSAIAVTYLTTAVTVRPVARLIDGRSLRVAVRVACIYNGLVLGASALFLQGMVSLILLAVAAGLGQSLSGVAGNLVLSQRSTSSRLGLLLGLKQSGSSLAGLFAGAALAISGVVPWRYCFAGYAVLAMAIAALAPYLLRTVLPEAVESAPPSFEIPWPTGALWATILAAAMISGATAAFAAPSLVHWGVGSATAGVVIVGAGIASVAVRVGLGALVDARPRWSFLLTGATAVTAAALLAAAVGLPVLRAPVLMVAYASASGYMGVAFFAALQRYSARPARAAALVINASGFGLGLGPALMGALWTLVGPERAWLIGATAALAVGVAGITRSWLVVRSVAAEPSVLRDPPVIRVAAMDEG
jgi:hypothetical protein